MKNNYTKNITLKNLISIIIFFIFSSSILKAETNETWKLIELFKDAFENTHKNYVEEISKDELIEKAINGMLSGLDPHSGYMNESKYKEMKIDTSGKFGGLGIQITMEEGLVKIISPIDDTPAYEAGLKSGDYITKIDGKSIYGLNLNEAVDLMRGKPGSKIIITIVREGSDSFDVTIIRDIIKIKSVKSEVYNNIGYLRITSFSEQTSSGLKKEINKIKKSFSDDQKIGYILDLRSNPGGLLNEAIAVSDMFIEKGEIVSTRGRNNENKRSYYSKPGDIIKGDPLVVLINEGSASASEIVAGAIQDHKRGIIIGTKSFGKGSVQSIIPLRNYRNKNQGAMKLTTARYYTPSGESIQAKGINPDINIKQGKFEENNYETFSESDLAGSLDNEKINKENENSFLSKISDDYQLMRALDIANALLLLNNN